MLSAPGVQVESRTTLILDRESNRENRRVTEMLHINYINNTINRQEDTQFLNSHYKRLNRIFNKFDVKENKKSIWLHYSCDKYTSDSSYYTVIMFTRWFCFDFTDENLSEIYLYMRRFVSTAPARRASAKSLYF